MRTSMLVVAGALCATSPVTAYQGFQDNIPNGANVLDADGVAFYGVGHNLRFGGGPRNQFGLDFNAAGKTWTNALCNMDSDGDGTPNGVELGDPECIWEKGDTPTRNTSITHPGVGAAGIAASGTLTGAPQWVEAHGFMMTIAWMLLIPLAIAFPVLFKNRTDSSINWLFYHRAFVGVGLIMVLVAVILAITNSQSTHFATTHGKLGLSTVIVAFVQVASGVFRPHKEAGHQSSARAVWEPVHWWTGRGVVVLAAAAVYTGYEDNLSWYTESASAVGIAMVCVTGAWGVACIVYKLVLSPTKSSVPDRV